FPAQGGAYGHVRLMLGDAAEELCGAFEVYELAVDPAYARLGLGTRLLEATLPAGPAWLLTLAKADRARAFYQRLGWRLRGEGHGIVVYVRH
ncbi:MAG: GNAT family N-acetyltransferase, partial [Actinoplanes sp.]